ncbi:Type I phosphodiesterase/nucleotide pyrophosphatase [Candidatus Sulfopaludibacter sp. SbA3]|nr:Type I phosphodiesterase/nucleotide pyrophosphatase [Candidatus Sulfopaludibacter sp. SbA3]
MKKLLLCALAAASLLAAAPKKPKLILAVVFDQFRYDYLERFRSEYHAAFDRLLNGGAVFTSAHYQHFPTVTAIGHSTFLSGALPSVSGIIGNEWYERADVAPVTSVSDPDTKLVGGLGGDGSSPHRMLVSTVGDELKMANGGKSRVIGISLKDRAAILPAGHMANGAYWLDNATGNFVSSTYYFETVPEWVKSFNDARLADHFSGAKWLDHILPTETPALYTALATSPFGNEMIESFAERALESEQLGKHEDTDILAVSFSSNDYIGHDFGPDSPEVHEISVRSDALLEKLFQALDRQVGMDRVLVVMTADHGVAPAPEVNTARHMPGGRMPKGIIADTVQKALRAKYGNFDWITNSQQEHSVYLNWELIAFKKLDLAEVTRTAARAIEAIPHVWHVYTRDQLMHGEVPRDEAGRDVMNGYFPGRGGDIEVLLEPYWLFVEKGTSHSTTFDYDTHVPLIFMGAGIRAGRYHQSVTINDVAPTLSNILQVETPSGSAGRVLTEMYQ